MKATYRYRNRLGPWVQPHRDLCLGPQRVRLEPEGRRVEAHAGAGPDQPGGNLRQVVPAGEQVCSGQRRPAHLRLLLREGEWLVIFSWEMHLHLYLGRLANAFIQSDLQ